MKYRIGIFTTVLFVVACQQEQQTQLEPLDLLPYGVPVNIMAPDSAEVNTMDMVVTQDITVQKGDDYFVQIYVSEASTTDIPRIKANQLSEVKSNRYFSRIVQEDEAGFIYETAIDSSNVNYGFRYLMVKGDKELIFQTGLIGDFDLQDVEQMYQAVQPQK